MDYEGWFEKALTTISTLSSGDTFEAKDLFKGTEWDLLTNGEKRSVGRYFSSKVNDGVIGDVARKGEGKTHHNEYVKR